MRPRRRPTLRSQLDHYLAGVGGQGVAPQLQAALRVFADEYDALAPRLGLLEARLLVLEKELAATVRVLNARTEQFA